jgi:hypothetical protein
MGDLGALPLIIEADEAAVSVEAPLHEDFPPRLHRVQNHPHLLQAFSKYLGSVFVKVVVNGNQGVHLPHHNPRPSVAIGATN